LVTCPSCGKQNQAHYKFCLGCGGELPADRVAETTAKHAVPSPFAPAIREDNTREGPPPPKPPPQRAAGSSSLNKVCPGCGAENDPHHRFCSNCGSKLDAPARAGQARARLTSLNPDGSEGTVFPLPDGSTTVGRSTGGIFAGDHYLSPRHASFTPQRDAVVVKDEVSLNGVFRRLLADQRYPLSPGRIFRIGQELIRFEQLNAKGADEFGVEPMGAPIEGYVGRIAMVLGRGTSGTAFPVPETGLNLGRERGEVLFSDDGYVSGLHCRISFEAGQVFLTDLGSSNGTFVRIEGSDQFANGEVLLMGQQLFRITL
jgi:pSer/pThr/pTyr-binding forkhead associated (FHA) protein